MYKSRAFYSVFFLMIIFGANIARSESLNYNVISLDAQVEEQVERDELNVVLLISEVGQNRQEVASKVTNRSNEVLRKLKNYTDLQVEMTSRNAYPNMKKNKVDTWTDQVYLTIRSKKFDHLTKAIAQVQTQAAVNNLYYSVSKEKKKNIQNSLIEKGLNAFSEKALKITQLLRKKSYQIVKIDMNESAYFESSQVMARSKNMLADESKLESMEVAPGKQEIKMIISGSIQLN